MPSCCLGYTMDLDDDLCLCFHVSPRKVLNFLRVERPRRAGQLAECFGAGTGCGWCRPFLQRLFEQAAASGVVDLPLPARERYAAMRAEYLRQSDDRQTGDGTSQDESPHSEHPS